MEITTHDAEIISEHENNTGKEIKITGRTMQAIKLVTENGLDPKTALMVVTGNMKPHRNTVSNLKAKCAKWSIERPAAQKIAHSALVNFASGRVVNGIEPRASDVRACAERIIDQATPVTRRLESLNVNVDACPVDLSRYLSER